MTFFTETVRYALTAMLTLTPGVNAQEGTRTVTELTTQSFWLYSGFASLPSVPSDFTTLVTSIVSPTTTVTTTLIVTSPVINVTVMANPTTITNTVAAISPSQATVNSTTFHRPTAGISTAVGPSGWNWNSTTQTTSWLKQSATGVIFSASKSSITSANVQRPTTCGESGNFTLGWDDEPSFTPTDPSSAHYPPIFNPYHHLYFSNGYLYAPQPDESYQPVSPPKLALFLPNASAEDIGSPDAGGVYPGEIGAGPRASSSAFWFNAYSVYLGCESEGPFDCFIEVEGLVWNKEMQKEESLALQEFIVPQCPGLVNCQLHHVEFREEFLSLSGLRFMAIADDGDGGIAPHAFYMDNLSLAWWNNTCEAGLQRQMSKK